MSGFYVGVRRFASAYNIEALGPMNKSTTTFQRILCSHSIIECEIMHYTYVLCHAKFAFVSQSLRCTPKINIG
jgi:hypothetical protein